MRPNGWSLVELLVVIAVLVLLTGVMLPSLEGAKEQARLAACGAQMHHIHVAICSYASANRNVFPPFAFSDTRGDLAISGHWGGASQAGDPAAFGRLGVGCVNLWTLVREGALSPASLLCPGAAPELAGGQESYFPHTCRFSTYALRFPHSADLFNWSPGLAGYGGGGLLGIYLRAAGGQSVPVGQYRQSVPQVRIDLDYRIASPAACGDGQFSPAADALAADTFWRADFAQPAASTPGLTATAVRWQLCHGERFNVLYGNGAVGRQRDDGTIRANSFGPSNTPADDGVHFATYAERIWQFFDSRR